MMHIILAVGLLWAGGITPSVDSEGLARFQAAEPHMGTKYIIVLYAPDQQAANQAFRAAFAHIAELDHKLSDYRADSELRQLTDMHHPDEPVPVSSALLGVLDIAQQVSRWSDGAFDVTVGPLTKLWRRARRQQQLPQAERLAAARRAVGWRNLQLDSENHTVRLTQPNMRLDLGGIAKGFAVDQALAVLRKHGIERALVNASGDMAASGPPPGKPGWRVAIAPLQPDQPPTQFGWLAHRAIATSGDAFQFVEIAGKRYSHIVDPRTGLGLQRRSSVSVLARTCALADALASATSVLEPDDALKRVSARPDAELRVIYRIGEQTNVRLTCGFKQWLDN